MKKSQITIFIVLGIVIMIIFGLLYFVSKATSGIALEKKINKIYSEFLTSSDIQNYVTSCLDITTNNGLRIIGMQGGRLYDYQIKNGSKINSFYDAVPFNYSGEVYNASYGIRAPILSLIDDSQYPYAGSLNLSPRTKNPFFAFYNDTIDSKTAKLYTLSALCNEFWENYWNTTNASYTCETYSGANESSQQYLKQYILENVRKCANISFVHSPTYNITEGNISVLVLIGDEDVFVSLQYPLIISLKAKTPTIKQLEFNFRKKIRLKRLHELALHLIGDRSGGKIPKSEADNIFFNIEKDDPNDCRNFTIVRGNVFYQSKLPCKKEGMNVTKLSDYCLNPENNCNFDDGHFNYSDIIILKDSKSTLDGKPYLFVFAVENRKPALDYIDKSVNQNTVYAHYISNATEKTIQEVYGGSVDSYNIRKNQNQTIEIFPLGIDPDEDELVYNYSSASGYDLQNSLYYKSNSILEYTNYTLLNTGIEFNTGRKNANIDQNDLTPNVYSFNITVTDNEGLKDWQEVTIRIDP